MPNNIRKQNGSNSTENTTLSLDNITRGQRQKVNYLLSIYDDQQTVMKLVGYLDYRGRNGWIDITTKIDKIINASALERMYIDAIYNNIDIAEQYSSDQIIQLIGETRRKLGLRAYVGQIRRSCEDDFFSLFIVKNVTEPIAVNGEVKERIVAYQPVFRLKPED